MANGALWELINKLMHDERIARYKTGKFTIESEYDPREDPETLLLERFGVIKTTIDYSEDTGWALITQEYDGLFPTSYSTQQSADEFRKILTEDRTLMLMHPELRKVVRDLFSQAK